MAALLHLVLLIVIPVATCILCDVGEELLLPGNSSESEFTTGEYKRFEIPHGDTQMCFYTRSLGECLDTDGFFALADTQNRKQHPKDYTVFNTSNNTNPNRMVSFRMLEPDQALDEAFAIRLYNETVVYFVTGHSCMVRDALYSEWTPVLFIYKDEDSMPPCNCENVTATSPSSTVTEHLCCNNDIIPLQFELDSGNPNITVCVSEPEGSSVALQHFVLHGLNNLAQHSEDEIINHHPNSGTVYLMAQMTNQSSEGESSFFSLRVTNGTTLYIHAVAGEETPCGNVTVDGDRSRPVKFLLDTNSSCDQCKPPEQVLPPILPATQTILQQPSDTTINVTDFFSHCESCTLYQLCNRQAVGVNFTYNGTYQVCIYEPTDGNVTSLKHYILHSGQEQNMTERVLNYRKKPGISRLNVRMIVSFNSVSLTQSRCMGSDAPYFLDVMNGTVLFISSGNCSNLTYEDIKGHVLSFQQRNDDSCGCGNNITTSYTSTMPTNPNTPSISPTLSDVIPTMSTSASPTLSDVIPTMSTSASPTLSDVIPTMSTSASPTQPNTSVTDTQQGQLAAGDILAITLGIILGVTSIFWIVMVKLSYHYGKRRQNHLTTVPLRSDGQK